MMRSLFLLVWLAASTAWAQTPCVPVSGTHIFGADLARAVPAFRSIAAGAEIAPSPLPGAQRRFSPTELQTLASRFNVTSPGSNTEVCFQLATQPLDLNALVDAIRTALSIDHLNIEILETSNDPVPQGRVEFRRQDLIAPSNPLRNSPVTWHGDVIYGDNRRFGIWARVKLSAPLTHLIAVSDLRLGIPVAPSQVRMETLEGFPIRNERQATVESISGRIPLRSVSAGGEILPENFVQPNDVSKGDTVLVNVRMGAARVALTARAETSGHIGDWIQVRNTETSRIFRARVESAGNLVLNLSSNGEQTR